MVPEYELIIDSLLSFSGRSFAWCLPCNHILYYNYNRSMNNITVSNLIILLDSFKMCTGVKMFTSGIIPHVIQNVFNINYQNNLFPIDQNVYYRSKDCKLLLSDGDVSSDCTIIQKYENNCANKKKACEPAKLKAPISVTSPERIKLTLKMHREENKVLLTKITQL